MMMMMMTMMMMMVMMMMMIMMMCDDGDTDDKMVTKVMTILGLRSMNSAIWHFHDAMGCAAMFHSCWR